MATIKIEAPGTSFLYSCEVNGTKNGLASSVKNAIVCNEPLVLHYDSTNYFDEAVKVEVIFPPNLLRECFIEITEKTK